MDRKNNDLYAEQIIDLTNDKTDLTNIMNFSIDYSILELNCTAMKEEINKDNQEILKQEKEKVEIINEVLIPERLTCCPECKEKGMVNSVKRLQFEIGRYWVCCTRRNECSFLKEYEGKAVVTKEDLIMYGLPGQLADHTDIFYEDISKVVRLCMSEYIKMKYLMSPTTDFDLKGVEESIRRLAEFHGLEGFSEPNKPIKTDECDFRNHEDLAKIIANPLGLQGSSQLSPISIAHESDMRAEEKFVTTLASFDELNGFNLPTEINNCELMLKEVPVETLSSSQDLNSSSIPSQPMTKNDPDSTGDEEDLLNMFQNNFFNQPSQPTNTISGDLTFNEEEKNKFLHSSDNSKIHFKSPNCFGSSYSIRKLAESLVADLPLLYKDKIKAAFYKIDGYNFPEDFLNMTIPDKLPLFKNLQERERQERIKAEVNEQLMDFMAEFDGINELLK